MRRRIESYLLHRFAAHYATLTGARRRALFASVEGRVIEIGAGTGANFAQLPRGLHWTGVDPNPHGATYAQREAERAGCTGFRYVTAHAEQLPFDDASFDACIATLTLCSVRDVTAALAEVRRVLRPGGAFYFMEHVAGACGSVRLRRQRLARPWFRLIAGCTPDRDTAASLQGASFASVELERFTLDLPIVGPHIAGVARR